MPLSCSKCPTFILHNAETLAPVYKSTDKIALSLIPLIQSGSGVFKSFLASLVESPGVLPSLDTLGALIFSIFSASVFGKRDSKAKFLINPFNTVSFFDLVAGERS